MSMLIILLLNSVRLSGSTLPVLTLPRSRKGSGKPDTIILYIDYSLWMVFNQLIYTSIFQVLSTLHPGQEEKMKRIFLRLKDYFYINYIYYIFNICIFVYVGK